MTETQLLTLNSELAEQSIIEHQFLEEDVKENFEKKEEAEDIEICDGEEEEDEHEAEDEGGEEEEEQEEEQEGDADEISDDDSDSVKDDDNDQQDSVDYEDENYEDIDSLDEDMPLMFTWNAWEQVASAPQASSQYSENTSELAKISTVQDFWKVWCALPQPSHLLLQRRMVHLNEGQPQVVDALMLFRDKVSPMWEDPMNARGGHFEFRITTKEKPAQVDEWWNNLALSLIGGQIEPSDLVTGIRLVDKLGSSKNGCLRIEVWFSDYQKMSQESLKEKIESAMLEKLDGSESYGLPTPTVKLHSKSK